MRISDTARSDTLKWITKITRAFVAGAVSFAIIPFATLNPPEQLPVQIRQLTETEKAKLYLFQKTGYDFAKYKKLEKIITCESGFDIEAYNPKSKDSGLFQINFSAWDKRAKKLGLDYKNSWRDNISLAFVILDEQGVRAWKASYKCHKISKI